MLVLVNCTQFSFVWLVRGEVTTDRLGSDLENRPDRYCVTEHMVCIDFHAINKYLENSFFFIHPKI